jgi:hypothetical protein
MHWRSLNRWGAIVLLLLMCAGNFTWARFLQSANVRASSGRLTLKKDDGGTLKIVDRHQAPELWYRVTLEEAPVTRKLALTCDWTSPAGKVVRRNRYETKEITRATWPTYARFQLTPDAPTGTWTVRLLLEGRQLHSLTFEVRDGQ